MPATTPLSPDTGPGWAAAAGEDPVDEVWPIPGSGFDSQLDARWLSPGLNRRWPAAVLALACLSGLDVLEEVSVLRIYAALPAQP